MTSSFRLGVLLMAMASLAHAQFSKFSGLWENADPKTQGVTNLEIRVEGDVVTVQAWGKCYPKDCDWGRVNAFAYAPSISSNLTDSARALSAVFVTNFSQNLMIIHAGEYRLYVEILTRFTDNSERTNYQAFYTFTQAAPQLTVETVDEFISWAGRSDSAGHLRAREEILKTREDSTIIASLFDRFESSRTNDLGTSLIILGMIGEMKNPRSLERFATLLKEPLPEEVEVLDAGLNERDLTEMIAAKAVECAAYLRTPVSDSLTMWAIQHHPSVVVRAAAIDAYLWNHGDSTEAKERLKLLLSPAERPFLDRVRRSSAGTPEAFNAGLERFYELHPEQLPPKLKAGDQERRPEHLFGETSYWLPFLLLGILVLGLIVIFVLVKRKRAL